MWWWGGGRSPNPGCERRQRPARLLRALLPSPPPPQLWVRQRGAMPSIRRTGGSRTRPSRSSDAHAFTPPPLQRPRGSARSAQPRTRGCGRSGSEPRPHTDRPARGTRGAPRTPRGLQLPAFPAAPQLPARPAAPQAHYSSRHAARSYTSQHPPRRPGPCLPRARTTLPRVPRGARPPRCDGGGALGVSGAVVRAAAVTVPLRCPPPLPPSASPAPRLPPPPPPPLAGGCGLRQSSGGGRAAPVGGNRSG